VTEQSYYVAVIGAGPAGMFAARELARNGAKVVIFNRDIKPGGLAEYGIYPDKLAMKEGLRTQFRAVLDTPGLTYYGNVTVSAQGDLTLEELRACGFQAILVTVGAQGTKWLGLPGEDLIGVYHAKDLVYHYNLLPPYTQMPFRYGKRVGVVGAGNVMLDISRFFIQKIKVDEVIAVVRRGPAEVKFDKKEMEFVIANLSQRALDDEIARVAPIMQAVGQDPAAARANILEALPKAQPTNSASRFRFEFLVSPTQILGTEEHYVTGLEVEDNALVSTNGDTKASGTGNKRVIPVDTVIFAIGDKVDQTFGLPTVGYEFAKNPQPRFPVDGHSYEAYDPKAGAVIPDVFVAGWARQASTGLVGIARKDGTNGSKAVLQYLQTLQAVEVQTAPLEARLKTLGKPVVTATDVRNLREMEEDEAKKRGAEAFKFGTNEEMLGKIMSVG
jgi:ferredoxin--NADP+ reductase